MGIQISLKRKRARERDAPLWRQLAITASKIKRADSVIVRAQNFGHFVTFYLRLTNKVSIFKLPFVGKVS
jgi:hypothetical protein